MEKISTMTADITAENEAKILELFPQVATEVEAEDGSVKQAIDFDALRDLLGDVAEGQRERYQFTWPGKRNAKEEARRPIDKTLIPCPEKSVDWDTTENLYIEGDNLEVLKILKETYAGKVKLIYIDPPYNTGHDFVYDDDFAQSNAEYAAKSGEYDEEDGRLVANLESNGRFHSDWCSMIYPRLVLARDLLSDDGSIYISIDDMELDNLRKICFEIFGQKCFIANIVWQKKYAATNDAKGFSVTHDYIVCISKNCNKYTRNLLPRTAEQNAPYKHNDNDGKGLWRSDNLLVRTFSQSGVYPILNPNTGVEYYPPKGSCWRASQDTMKKWLQENRIYFGKDGKGAPQLKRYLNEVKQGRVPITWWNFEECGHNDAANKEVKALFDGMTPFDTPKPTSLLNRILQIGSNKDSIVLDFFSGAGTFAHSVMQLNADDCGKRKYILVQIPESCVSGSVGARAGYRTICEIGEERIRRAGAKIKAEIEEENAKLEGTLDFGDKQLKKVPDIGFRVLRIDSSNFKDTSATPDQFVQESLFDLSDNLKEGRSSLDILFQVLPAFRIPYSAKIEKIKVAGKNAFAVEGNQLIACFDLDLTNEAIEEIAKMEPVYAVFRDASLADDATAANLEELFKTFSPDTVRRVI